jgi:hypothetical protein
MYNIYTYSNDVKAYACQTLSMNVTYKECLVSVTCKA